MAGSLLLAMLSIAAAPATRDSTDAMACRRVFVLPGDAHELTWTEVKIPKSLNSPFKALSLKWRWTTTAGTTGPLETVFLLSLDEKPELQFILDKRDWDKVKGGLKVPYQFGLMSDIRAAALWDSEKSPDLKHLREHYQPKPRGAKANQRKLAQQATGK